MPFEEEHSETHILRRQVEVLSERINELEAQVTKGREERSRMQFREHNLFKAVACLLLLAIAEILRFAGAISNEFWSATIFDAERLKNAFDTASYGCMGLAAALFAGKPGEAISAFLNKGIKSD
jgi:hypothetical protein